MIISFSTAPPSGFEIVNKRIIFNCFIPFQLKMVQYDSFSLNDENMIILVWTINNRLHIWSNLHVYKYTGLAQMAF